MTNLFLFSKYFSILYHFFLFWSLYHMGSSFISLKSCLMSLKLFILSKIYLSLFSSLFIFFSDYTITIGSHVLLSWYGFSKLPFTVDLSSFSSKVNLYASLLSIADI